MTINPSEKKIYCFDTSAFVTLSRTSENIIEVPVSLWDHLEKMMQDENIISHQLVFDEINSNSKNPDFITKWIANKKNSFLKRTEMQISLMPQIVKDFPDLIDPNREHEQADVWLIALAIEKSRELTLFQTSLIIVVSQENPHSSKKIPAACRFFGIRHFSLREFFDELGFSLTLSRK